MAISRPILGRIVLVLLLFLPLLAGAAGTDLYLFWARGCPHCEREIVFLSRFEAEHPEIRIHYLEITAQPENRELLVRYAQRAGIRELSVPLTLIGGEVFVGYADDATTGEAIRQQALACVRQGCPDPLATATPGKPRAQAAASSRTVNLPLVGEVTIAHLSLPALTVLLGALDGFNPCAMWVLVFLIGLLLGMEDRWRMWTLGSAFIAGSAAVYFLFMAAWLNLLLFIGMLAWVRAGIGLVALAGGGWYLREYFINPAGVCSVTAPERRKRVFERLRRLVTEGRFLVALVGILALAFAVNLVELMCSAGIPAVYTQILTMSELPTWQYYGYLLLYILVFMLDDLIVFLLAMKTLQIAGLTTRYARYSHLIGGVVLMSIGALLLLRPEWLMYG